MKSAIKIQSNTIDAEIRRLSGLRFRTLGFARALEASFEDATRPDRCKRLWLEGLFAVGIFNLVLVAGQFSHPTPHNWSLILKLYLFTPVAILVNMSMLLKPSTRLRESSIAAVTVALGFSVLAFEHNRGLVSALLSQFGLAIVLIFSHSVMRLRFNFALAVSAFLAFGEVVFVLLDKSQDANTRTLGLCVTFAALIFTAIANYSHNRQERLGFLLCLRGDLLICQLNEENDNLVLAAEQDALTGLANRRAFDRRIQESWTESTEKGFVLAVILIDIDHFKRLNDSFGHLFGDRVLRRVGRLLQESLRGKADFVARFGGEEFVILLPGTALENAVIVAERIRNVVEVAGLPALETETSLGTVHKATVSCGVSAGSPLQFEDVQSFLDAADRALYRAKASGRNCICANPESGVIASRTHAMPQAVKNLPPG